jgi:hypothetical protein
MVRLLTAVGDLVLPARSIIQTREGPQFAADVAEKVTKGRAVRLQVLRPQDLPHAPPTAATDRKALRTCLAGLPHPVVRVPAVLGVDREIRSILKHAGVTYREIRDDRWHAFRFEPLPPPPSQHTDAGSVAALTVLSAWSRDGERLTARFTIRQSQPYRRLLAALSASGQSWVVQWLPGYYPVGCHVTAAAPDAVPLYPPVSHAVAKGIPALAIHLDVAGEGSLVNGLAIIRQTPS